MLLNRTGTCCVARQGERQGFGANFAKVGCVWERSDIETKPKRNSVLQLLWGIRSMPHISAYCVAPSCWIQIPQIKLKQKRFKNIALLMLLQLKGQPNGGALHNAACLPLHAYDSFCLEIDHQAYATAVAKRLQHCVHRPAIHPLPHSAPNANPNTDKPLCAQLCAYNRIQNAFPQPPPSSAKPLFLSRRFESCRTSVLSPASCRVDPALDPACRKQSSQTFPPPPSPSCAATSLLPSRSN